MRKLSPNAKPVTILKAVAARIQAEPKLYNQEQFIQKHTCGTRYCVAGWVNHLTDGDPADGRRAERLLGLNRQQGGELFSANAVDEEAECDMSEQIGTPAYARAGVAHIEKFMRRHLGYTGPKLWQVKAKAAKVVKRAR